MKLYSKLILLTSLSFGFTNSLHLLKQNFEEKHTHEQSHNKLEGLVEENHQIALSLASVLENHEQLPIVNVERVLQETMDTIKELQARINQNQQRKQTAAVADQVNQPVQQVKKEKSQGLNMTASLNNQHVNKIEINNQNITTQNYENNQEIIKEELISVPVKENQDIIMKPTDHLVIVQTPQKKEPQNASIQTKQQSIQNNIQGQVQNHNLTQSNPTTVNSENHQLNNTKQQKLKPTDMIQPSVSSPKQENLQNNHVDDFNSNNNNNGEISLSLEKMFNSIQPEKKYNITNKNESQMKNNDLPLAPVTSKQNENVNLNIDISNNHDQNGNQMINKPNSSNQHIQTPIQKVIQPVQEKEAQKMKETKDQNQNQNLNQNKQNKQNVKNSKDKETQVTLMNKQNSNNSQQDNVEVIKSENKTVAQTTQQQDMKESNLSQNKKIIEQNKNQMPTSSQEPPIKNDQNIQSSEKKEDPEVNNSQNNDASNNEYKRQNMQQNKAESLQDTINKYYQKVVNMQSPFTISSIVGVGLLGLASIILLVFCICCCCRKCKSKKELLSGRSRSTPPSSDFDNGSNIFSEVPPSSERQNRKKGFGRQNY